ncbi:MAG: hypothetical protein ACRD0O_11785 [Acidimicrobiia bacterium]
MTRKIGSPAQMRQAVADYVTATHRAYLASAADLPPAVAGAMPLLAGDGFSVLAVGAGDLHLIATHQSLPPARAGEVGLAGEVGGLRWRLCFYDSVVMPELGSLAPGVGPVTAEDVRRLLGVETWLYHLVASPRAGLSAHNALHAGVALAQGHAGDVMAAQAEVR